MTLKFHIAAAALAAVLLCSAAGAQVRDGSTSVRRSPVHTRAAPRASANSAGTVPAGQTASRQASVIQISPSGRVTSGFAPLANSFDLDTISGVPGLGFDFPHLAAISGATGGNSSLRFGNIGRRGRGSFVPILFGGYPYYYDDLGYDQPDQQSVQPTQPQSQIIVIQQPVPTQQTADSANDAGNPSASTSETQAALPVPDVGDFILVRKDGRILFASVYSIVGTQMQYVTPDGIRRTIAMSDLDADATLQMNEARGTTVQIHN